MLRVPWSTSFFCLAASAHRACRLYWGMKTQGVRACQGLPMEKRLMVSVAATSVLWCFIPRKLCITEPWTWQKALLGQFTPASCLGVIRKKIKLVVSTEPVWILWSFCFSNFATVAEKMLLQPKSQQQHLPLLNCGKHPNPRQDSSLGSIPTQTPCTPKTGTLGMPPVVLTVLVSPRSGFKCTSPNISNIDRAISLKGQHWSLLYTRCGGYLY